MKAHSELVTSLSKPGTEIAHSITASQAHLLHMAVGVVGEVAEIAQALREVVIFRRQLELDNLLEEVGDTEFYLEGLRQGLGLTFEKLQDFKAELELPAKVEGIEHQMTLITFGLTVASGMLIDQIKKHVIYNKPLNIERISKELRTIDFFLEGVYASTGASRDTVLQLNIDKLTKRYGDSYSDTKAQVRADKGEQSE